MVLLTNGQTLQRIVDYWIKSSVCCGFGPNNIQVWTKKYSDNFRRKSNMSSSLWGILQTWRQGGHRPDYTGHWSDTPQNRFSGCHSMTKLWHFYLQDYLFILGLGSTAGDRYSQDKGWDLLIDWWISPPHQSEAGILRASLPRPHPNLEQSVILA